MQVVKNRFIYFGISLVLIIVGFASMIYNASKGHGAFNYDIQFTGGTSIQVEFDKEVSNDEMSEIFKEIAGEEPAQIQELEGNVKLIKTKSLSPEMRSDIQQKIIESYEVEEADFIIQDVSGTISAEMKRTAILSVVLACIAMLIYLAFRFKDLLIALSIVIALLQDALVVLASYALLRIPLNNNFIAVMLTVLGYSINASIVIFDRVRENRRIIGRNNFEELVDVSVRQTVTRSLFTSATTFFTIFCLYLFGVDAVKQFALPISVGIVAGTYSSIFISGNAWYVAVTKSKARANNKK